MKLINVVILPRSIRLNLSSPERLHCPLLVTETLREEKTQRYRNQKVDASDDAATSSDELPSLTNTLYTVNVDICNISWSSEAVIVEIVLSLI